MAIAIALSSFMHFKLSPSALLTAARTHSGLSQREIAARAGTAQSVVARIERGLTDPRSGTLLRILSAAGLEVACELREPVAPDTHMLADVARILAMTPEQRLDEVRNISRFAAAARRS